MREILFRGKSVGIGEWVEGSLRITTHQPTNDTPFKCYEIEDTTYGLFPDEFMSGICEEVDPETVGQFTGLLDKNGTKIFEGDVLNVLRSGVKWRCMVNDIRHMPWQIYGSSVERIEVIGNIHDNPELIGGGKDA